MIIKQNNEIDTCGSCIHREDFFNAFTTCINHQCKLTNERIYLGDSCEKYKRLENNSDTNKESL